MKEVIIGLNLLDITFLVIALISMAGNLYQFMQVKNLKEELRKPVYNSIVGLFMDIKTKMKNAALKQIYLAHKDNPHTEINTLKWEYRLFTLDVVNWMQGFQDELTGIIGTLNPKDKTGADIIKAQEFGQDEIEIATRRLTAQIYLKSLEPQVKETEEPAK